MTNADKLYAAYHAIFDIKDTLTPGSDEFVAAAKALFALHELMFMLGIDTPLRYDRPRVDNNAPE